MLGAALGSFSLVLAYRNHSGEDWVRGRSRCDNCHKTLRPLDMIPVFSWLVLRGKCRFCKHRLDWRLLAVELGLGLICLLSFIIWPWQLDSTLAWVHFASWLVCLPVLSALFWYDLNWQLLPDNLLWFLAGAASVEGLLQLSVEHGIKLRGIFGLALAGLVIWLFFWLLYKVSRGRWIGDGDSYLGAALGLIAGSLTGSFMVVFISSVLGTLIALPFTLKKTWAVTKQIAFGPLLIAAVIVVQLSGNRLVDWYLRVVLGS